MAEFLIWDSDEWNEDLSWEWDDLWSQLECVDGNWVVFGTLGLWDGPRRVWATGKCCDLIQKCVNNMDEVQITENGRGKVSIICQHHDGTNTFELRQLPYSGNFGTEKQMRKHSRNAHLRHELGWL